MVTPSPDLATEDAIEPPDVSHLVTEDDTPVDNIRSEKQQRLLTEPLYSCWQPVDADGGQRPFLATANVGLYLSLNGLPLVPDVMLGMDVSAASNIDDKPNRAWLSWVVGKAPDIVIEVVSNREGDELGRKRRRYAEMRIPWYVVWDPAQRLSPERLRVFELAGDLFVPRVAAAFTTVGLSLVPWDGLFEDSAGPWLRWALPDGTLVPTGAERAQASESRAQASESRAQASESRAQASESRAQASESRAQALEAKLRALGISLD